MFGVLFGCHVSGGFEVAQAPSRSRSVLHEIGMGKAACESSSDVGEIVISRCDTVKNTESSDHVVCPPPGCQTSVQKQCPTQNGLIGRCCVRVMTVGASRAVLRSRDVCRSIQSGVAVVQAVP